MNQRKRERGSSLVILLYILSILAMWFLIDMDLQMGSAIFRKEYVDSVDALTELATVENIIEESARWSNELSPSASSANNWVENARNKITEAIAGDLKVNTFPSFSFSGTRTDGPPSQYPAAVQALSNVDFSNWDLGFELKRFVEAGPAYEYPVGSLHFTYTNYDMGDLSYRFDLHRYEVPITNFNLIVYGLPANGSVLDAPLDLGGIADTAFWASGGTIIMPTSNNPATDNTVIDGYYELSGEQVLPAYYRHEVALAFNAYEYIWNSPYISNIYNDASTSVFQLKGELTESSTIPGVTYNPVDGVTTVDLDVITGSIWPILRNTNFVKHSYKIF